MSLAREDSSAREIFSDLFVVIAYQQWHDSIRKISYNIRPYVLSNLDWDHTLWSQFNRRRTFLKVVTYFFSDWETPLVLDAQNWQLISLTFLTVYISHCCVSILAALGASLHTSVLAEHRLTTECYEPGQLRLSLPVHSCLTAHCRWSTVAYTHGVSWHPTQLPDTRSSTDYFCLSLCQRGFKNRRWYKVLLLHIQSFFLTFSTASNTASNTALKLLYGLLLSDSLSEWV